MEILELIFGTIGYIIFRLMGRSHKDSISAGLPQSVGFIAVLVSILAYFLIQAFVFGVR